MLHLAIALGDQVITAKQDLAGGDLRLRPLHEAQHREPGDGLTASRLTDQTQYLMLVHGEIDAVKRLDQTAHAAKLQPEIPDYQKLVHAAHLLERGSSTSRRPSPTRLNANTRMRIAKPGKVPSHQYVKM